MAKAKFFTGGPMIWYEYKFLHHVGLIPNEYELNQHTADAGWELRDWHHVVDEHGTAVVCCLRRPLYFSDPDGSKRSLAANYKGTAPFDKPTKV